MSVVDPMTGPEVTRVAAEETAAADLAAILAEETPAAIQVMQVIQVETISPVGERVVRPVTPSPPPPMTMTRNRSNGT